MSLCQLQQLIIHQGHLLSLLHRVAEAVILEQELIFESLIEQLDPVWEFAEVARVIQDHIQHFESVNAGS